MGIGYACKTMGVRGLEQKSCVLRTATPEKLEALCAHNIEVLDRTIAYNRKQDIPLFRISSDLIPFATNPVNTLDWPALFGARLRAVGEGARGMRLSMHPGQYTVLNSPKGEVVEGAVAELRYHARFLDLLGLGPEHKMILHIGGVYGDKPAAIRRFIHQARALDDFVRARLVIENDDRMYHIADVLTIAEATGLPVIFDTLHHEINPPPDDGKAPLDWLSLSGETWRERDGRQKIHYSQQAAGKHPGAHSDTIDADRFLDFYRSLDHVPDIMLEVKDKNLSANKVITCLQPSMRRLEAEWARWKYAVLERSQPHYLEIRALLKDKSAAPAAAFYRLVDEAMMLEPENAVSAAEHVWGYCRKQATAKEKAAFLGALDGLRRGTLTLRSLKSRLARLSAKYGQDYLLDGYYFCF